MEDACAMLRVKKVPYYPKQKLQALLLVDLSIQIHGEEAFKPVYIQR